MTIVRAPGRVNLIGDHTDYQDGWCLPMAIDLELRIEQGRISSTIPIGAGLSSSAAFHVATLLASGSSLTGRDLALAAQEAEQRATGVPCGVMDQMASVFGRRDHALLLDCRSLDVTPVRLPPDIAIVVVHSGEPRTLAGSAYADRRAACEHAAARAGVAALRDATIEQVADDPIARHVVTENARVLAFVDALLAHELEACGRLMNESHTSLRDDFRVSTPALDALTDALIDAGAFGARLTGAGFGGCAVALTAAADGAQIAARFGGWLVHAADGASIIG